MKSFANKRREKPNSGESGLGDGIPHEGAILTSRRGEGFPADFERAGGKVLFREIAPLGKDDFRTELARVRSLRPDVVIAAHFGPGLGALLKQLGDSGNRTPVVGVYEAEDPSVVRAAGVPVVTQLDKAEWLILYDPRDQVRPGTFVAVRPDGFDQHHQHVEKRLGCGRFKNDTDIPKHPDDEAYEQVLRPLSFATKSSLRPNLSLCRSTRYCWLSFAELCRRKFCI